MFIINLRNGQTLKIHSPDELKQTDSKLISAAAVLVNGTQHVLPAPLHFHNVKYRLECGDGFERIICYADDQLIKLTVYKTMAKTEIRRMRKIWQRNMV